MRIHVVGPRLRIIFQDKNRGVLPIRARGHFLHQQSERVIVVRNIKLRRRHVRTHPVRVIVRQIDNIERRQIVGSILFERFDVPTKLSDPVGDARISAKVRVRIRGRNQRVALPAGILGRTIRIGSHRVWRVQIEFAMPGADVPFQSLLQCKRHNGRGGIRIFALAIGVERIDFGLRNRRHELAV